MHVDHLLHEDTTQSSGQTSPQDLVALRVGHFLPPYAGLTLTLRSRLETPAPQVRLHEDHFFHKLTTQSTGQVISWQADASFSVGQPFPPYAAPELTVLLRDLSPVPQVTLQDDHFPYSLTTQSIAHTWTLHDFVSLEGPHFLPPYATGTATVLVRCWYPVPQLFVQGKKLPQTDMTQLTGHL